MYVLIIIPFFLSINNFSIWNPEFCNWISYFLKLCSFDWTYTYAVRFFTEWFQYDGHATKIMINHTCDNYHGKISIRVEIFLSPLIIANTNRVNITVSKIGYIISIAFFKWSILSCIEVNSKEFACGECVLLIFIC